jgi:hypothetical protein
MPLDICRKLGLIPLQTDKKVTQLDKTEVPVVGELNNIHMQLASDLRVQSCIDISVVDIPEGYGMLVSRDWARKLNGYIATDFSHMWLPWKGIPNQIRIESTPRLRLLITEYGEHNEILFMETTLGSYIPKTGEVLMLQGYNQGGCPDVTPTFTKVPVMDDSKPSLNEGMFENFRNFVLKSIKQEVELGKDASIQNLLLPNWCRIHSAFHSEISCTMCKEAIAQVSKMVPQEWIEKNLVKVNSSCMKFVDPQQERI